MNTRTQTTIREMRGAMPGGKGRSPASGSVMLEFVIVFPVVLTLIFGVIQFGHIWVARLVVHYATYCAARAALVTVTDAEGPDGGNDSWPDRSQLAYRGFEPPFCRNGSIGAGRDGLAMSEAELWACKAAAQVCSWSVMGESSDEIGGGLSIAGWGRVPGAGATERKTRATVEIQDWNVGATVEHDFALITPFVGPMIAWGMNPWDPARPWADQEMDITGNVHAGLDTVRYPHIRLKETVWLPKPFRTVLAAENWQEAP